jgi:hypothetical protein
MPELPRLKDDDPLGRRVFSKRRALRAAKSKIIPDIFEQKGADALSVDRLDHVPDAQMATIADNTSNQSNNLQGWATVTVEKAGQSGRLVSPTPQLDNVYHVDIELNLPDGEEQRKHESRRHANELAAVARWRPRPS